ncbi:hypothetical protein Athai_41390 [Actinocatenispora thailandica]|uniref:Uncharacterized protein n=1 Tax=Actinocatenispora thailandica TaxID=227318 RepID=A0A7R7HYH1_9ACTN|nr:hypothetical protein Athai_41390 [Actinocatenispora thailandica]
MTVSAIGVRGGFRIGHGIAVLIRFLIRLAIWHFAFRALGGFLRPYTHVPWLGTIIVAILLFVLFHYARRWYRRRR